MLLTQTMRAKVEAEVVDRYSKEHGCWCEKRLYAGVAYCPWGHLALVAELIIVICASSLLPLGAALGIGCKAKG